MEINQLNFATLSAIPKVINPQTSSMVCSGGAEAVDCRLAPTVEAAVACACAPA